MKPSSKPRTTAVVTTTATNQTLSTSSLPSAAATDCETVSRSYQAQVLGITIFGVVGFVVFIKYVITKYFAELEHSQQQYQQHIDL